MLSLNTPPVQSKKIIGWFLLCWTALNVLQAATLGLHSDEAYYWMYSRFLDWGYFDHPPMVAVFIRLGDTLIPGNELGLRLITVILNPLAIYLIWLIAKKYKADARWFVVLVAGTFVFNIYGFITTPDAPLLFFTALFYYLYQKYLEEDKWSLALLLALVITCLLYSKYHGILLIAFTLIANWRLLKRKSFYLIVVLAVALYLPHILWQIHHHYPSLVYHLFERSSEVYQPKYTLFYLPGQLLMAGPFIGWFMFYYGFTTRIKNAFIRCLMVNSAGTYIFFFLNTIKGNVQPHWTLIAFVPLVLLVLIHLRQPGSKPLWFFKLAAVNVALIVLFRLLLIVHTPGLTDWRPVNSFFRYKTWARQIQQKAGNNYVIIPSSFQEPSQYNYYTRSLKAFGYDEYQYRRTQYNLWPLEDSLQNHEAIFITDAPAAHLTTDSIVTVKGKKYINPIINVRTFQRVDVQPVQNKVTAHPNERVKLSLTLSNPYATAIDFGRLYNGKPVNFSAYLLRGGQWLPEQPAGADIQQLKIPARRNGTYTFSLTAPGRPGKYDLIFSIRTTPFPGTRNSRIINFTVR